MEVELKRKALGRDVCDVEDCAVDEVAVVPCGRFRGFNA